MKIVFNLIVFLLVMSFVSVAHASLSDDFKCIKKLNQRSRGALLAEMDRKFEAVLGFTANFRQESRMLAGTGGVGNQGKVSFLKPGRMYWEYQNPSQLFVSNAETVWYYQPDGESVKEGGGEVTLIDFNRAFSSETPGSFLLGLGALSKEFRMVSGCETSKGYSVKLRPIIEDENLEEFFLLVRKWDNVAIGAKIVDFSENETIIRFYNIQTNPGLKERFFDFQIPRGVYVDDRRSRRSKKAALKPKQKKTKQVPSRSGSRWGEGSGTSKLPKARISEVDILNE